MTPEQTKAVTISEVIHGYLEMVKLARSKQTMLTYRNALRVFREVLITKNLDPDTTPTEELTEDLISALAGYLKS